MSELSERIAESVPFTSEVIAQLVAVEYAMVAAGGQLVELSDELAFLADSLPACRVAAHQVRRLRAMLGQVLECLDGPITEAARLHEAYQEAQADYTEDDAESIPF